MAEDEDRELKDPGGKLRIFVETSLDAGARVEPSPQQAHYLLHVMRARAGDRVSLFNGRDGEWAARVENVTRRDCALICERRTASQCDVPDIWLAFAPIKKTPADYLAQKATELGVRVLQPVITRRTVVHRVNTERMRANAIEAAEQSGRLTVPDVREAVDLGKLLQQRPAARRILFCDESGGPPIAEALAGATDDSWTVLTGPEGGFDPGEREMILALPDVLAVSLGERILRADTAALAALSVWQALKGDWR